MLVSNSKADRAKVKAVLLFTMVIGDGDDSDVKEKGDVVELSKREFTYLAEYGRVAEATPENIDNVKAEIAAEKKAAESRATELGEKDVLRARIAQLEAELGSKKGK
jgi:hypothetical protein